MSISEEKKEINYQNQVLFSSENEDDLDVDYLDKISDTVTWSTDWTVESVINSQKRGSFNINPSFQRRDAWTLKKKSRLIESLIYGLPIPQIVLAEDRAHRGKYIVVDGKQRLITLFSFFSDDKELSFELSELNSGKLNGFDRTKLEQTYPELYNNLLNQSLRSIIIKNWSTENLLYTIFYRLNSGSLPLSPQELRKALKPGEFLDLIDAYCTGSNALQKIMKETAPDPRMRDMDLILRYFVMTQHIDSYRGNYKKAVDDICDYYNNNWVKYKDKVRDILVSFEKTIDLSIKVFGEDNAFKRFGTKTERRINRALFDVIVSYFSKIPPDQLVQHADKIKQITQELCEYDSFFSKAISSNTNNLKEVSTRFVLYGRKLKEILGHSVRIPTSLEQHFSTIK